MNTIERLTAVEDPALCAEIVTRVPLLYAEGADVILDRPAHVRSASSIRWSGNRLAVIQDDAHFLALIDPSDLNVRALALPAGPGGLRQFDDLRGNKAFKLDLETNLVVQVEGEELFLAFGSGSTPERDKVAVVNVRMGTADLWDASGLYAELRCRTDFSGSELNIEGAILIEGVVRLFNRGNGAPRDGLQPVNATTDLDWRALWSYLENPRARPIPTLRNIVQYDLGTMHGIKLTFTDACLAGERIVFAAAAESSPDVTRDGLVAGSALGMIDDASKTVRYGLLREKNGNVFRGKVEGVTISRTEANQAYVVVDVDDPLAASELCVVRLSESWRIEMDRPSR
ncbi:MAG: hypothetical protein H7Z74_15830 [Anaerolineae bacterium]|nr:hypothetical protein [Gemmatimonadaceae bacterium]